MLVSSDLSLYFIPLITNKPYFEKIQLPLLNHGKETCWWRQTLTEKHEKWDALSAHEIVNALSHDKRSFTQTFQDHLHRHFHAEILLIWTGLN